MSSVEDIGTLKSPVFFFLNKDMNSHEKAKTVGFLF